MKHSSFFSLCCWPPMRGKIPDMSCCLPAEVGDAQTILALYPWETHDCFLLWSDWAFESVDDLEKREKKKKRKRWNVKREGTCGWVNLNSHHFLWVEWTQQKVIWGISHLSGGAIFCTEGPMLKEAIGRIIHSGGKGCQVEKKEKSLNYASQFGDITSLPNKFKHPQERQHLDILESKFLRSEIFSSLISRCHIPST